MGTIKSSSGFISLNDGTKLFYEQAGVGDDSKKTLLCIPGQLQSTRLAFSHQLDHLSKDFNIVSFDQRNYGKSFPHTKREFSVKGFHQDAMDAAEIMQKLGYGKYSVYGYSDGGMVGMILAAKYPSCVEKLVAGAANAFLTKEDLEYASKMDENEVVERNMEMVQLYGEEEFINMGRKVYEMMCGFVDTPDGDICIKEVREIKCRTLIIHCELDELVPKNHAEFLHKNVPDSTLHIVPHENHLFFYSKPEKVNEILINFVRN